MNNSLSMNDEKDTYCFNCGISLRYGEVIYGKYVTGCVHCTVICPKCLEEVFLDGWGLTDHLHEMDNFAGCCKACLKKAEEEQALWEDDEDLDDELDDDNDSGSDTNDSLNADDVKNLEEWKNLPKEERDQKLAELSTYLDQEIEDLKADINEKLNKL